RRHVDPYPRVIADADAAFEVVAAHVPLVTARLAVVEVELPADPGTCEEPAARHEVETEEGLDRRLDIPRRRAAEPSDRGRVGGDCLIEILLAEELRRQPNRLPCRD